MVFGFMCFSRNGPIIPIHVCLLKESVFQRIFLALATSALPLNNMLMSIGNITWERIKGTSLLHV
eukprot:4456801-Ditylum_brightwellii.AAC.1